MTQEQLVALASARFSPGTRVLVPAETGGFFHATVYRMVEGVFDGVVGVGLEVWPAFVLSSEVFELSWALEHIRVIA